MQKISVTDPILKIRMQTFEIWTLNDPKALIEAAAPKLMKKIRKPLLNVETFQTQTMKKKLKRIAIEAVEITKISEIVVNAEV